MHTLGCTSNTRARIVKAKTPTRGAHAAHTGNQQNKRTTPMSATTIELPTHGVNLTEVAQTKVRTLLEQEGRTDLRLRIAVQPGGCSGLIYQLYFDERVLDGDAVRNFDGVEVIVDKMSAPYLMAPPSTSKTPSKSRASPSTTPTQQAPAHAVTPSTKPKTPQR